MKIYFAHPCFSEEQEQFRNRFLEKFRRCLEEAGHRGVMHIVNPFDHSPNIEGSESAKVKLSAMVKDVCIALLEACDVVVALTDWNDTGVAFEAGYAHSLHIPVVLISKGRCAEANAMLLGAAAARFDHILEEGQVEALVAALEEYLISRVRNSEEQHTH